MYLWVQRRIRQLYMMLIQRLYVATLKLANRFPKQQLGHRVTCDKSNTSASLPSLFQEMKKPSWSTLNLQPSSTSSSLHRSKVSPSRSGLSTGMCQSRTKALVILNQPGNWGFGSRRAVEGLQSALQGFTRSATNSIPTILEQSHSVSSNPELILLIIVHLCF